MSPVKKTHFVLMSNDSNFEQCKLARFEDKKEAQQFCSTVQDYKEVMVVEGVSKPVAKNAFSF